MKELILYALRRFCMLIPFLIGLTLVAFLLGVLSPGDPALALLTMDGPSVSHYFSSRGMGHRLGTGYRHTHRNLGCREKRHRRGNSPSRRCSFLYFRPFFLPGHFMHAPFF